MKPLCGGACEKAGACASRKKRAKSKEYGALSDSTEQPGDKLPLTLPRLFRADKAALLRKRRVGTGRR
jgi:hypothetical protein